MTRLVLLTAFIIVILSTSSYNQNVFPSYQDHPTWGVEHCFWTYCNPVIYKYEKDTVLCGYNYSELLIGLNQAAYIRSDSLKAYVRLGANCSDKEYLMYDYSMEVGDTVYIGYNLTESLTQDTTMFVLEDVFYNGDFYKIFTLKYDRHNQGDLNDVMYWEGGMGSLTHPFYPLQCLSDHCESTYQLLCYNDSNPLVAPFGNCNIINATVSLEEQTPKFYPNPFQQKITIEVNPQKIMHLEIFDIQGKQVNSAAYRVDKSEWLSIVFQEELAGGTYLVRIQTKEEISSMLIMKE